MNTESILRLIRFGLVGGLNSALTYVIFLLVLQVASYPLAYSVAFLSGIAFSYLLNSFYVFRSHASWTKGWIYGAIYLIQYGVGLTAIAIQVEAWNVNPRIASLIAIAVLAPLNFLWARSLLTKFRP